MNRRDEAKENGGVLLYAGDLAEVGGWCCEDLVEVSELSLKFLRKGLDVPLRDGEHEKKFKQGCV